MKKFKVVFSILTVNIFFAGVATAQQQSGQGFYIKVYGGYGLLTPGSYNGGASFTSSSSNTAFSTPSQGLGAGVHFGGGIGVILNDFLNVAIDAEYLKGKDIKTTSSSSQANIYAIYKNKTSHNVTSIIPNVTFKAISKPGYYVYTRIGVLLAVSTGITTSRDDSTHTSSSTYTYVQSGKYSTNLSIGTTAAIGVQFDISGNLKGFAELVGFYLPSQPKSYTYNYSSKTLSATPSTSSGSVTYNYMKSGNYTSSTPYNAPKITNNINYIGLNAGVAYKF